MFRKIVKTASTTLNLQAKSNRFFCTNGDRDDFGNVNNVSTAIKNLMTPNELKSKPKSVLIDKSKSFKDFLPKNAKKVSMKTNQEITLAFQGFNCKK